jgi:hypothetical protein
MQLWIPGHWGNKNRVDKKDILNLTYQSYSLNTSFHGGKFEYD